MAFNQLLLILGLIFLEGVVEDETCFVVIAFCKVGFNPVINLPYIISKHDVHHY